MKSILISIKPRYVADILNHKKTIEVRKSMPKCDLPIDVYIYCTKDKKNCHLYQHSEMVGYFYDNFYKGLEHQPCTPKFIEGKVVAKFTLNKVEEILNYGLARRSEIMMEELLEKSCLTMGELNKYAPHKDYVDDDYIYAIHISDLEVFDKPKELSDLYSIVKEKIKVDCPLNRKGWCITNYDCKYYVEDDCWGGQLACSCPTKEVNIKKPLTKAPQSWCYVEEL